MSFTLPFLLAVLGALVIAFLIIMAKSNSGKRQSGRRFSGSGSLDGQSRSHVEQAWPQIEQLLDQQRPSALRQAVMDADNLLDYALKRIGASGTTMGERLKSSGKHFSAINDVWYAHKIRNQIAHEAGYELYPPEAKRVVSHFRTALKDLGAFR